MSTLRELQATLEAIQAELEKHRDAAEKVRAGSVPRDLFVERPGMKTFRVYSEGDYELQAEHVTAECIEQERKMNWLGTYRAILSSFAINSPASDWKLARRDYRTLAREEADALHGPFEPEPA